MAKKQQPPARRIRRSVDQLIADLEAKVAAIRAREAQRRAKADPAVKHARAALRSLDKALAAAKDEASRKAFGDARATLAEHLGAPAGGRGVRGRRAADTADMAEALLAYVRSNPGQRGEQIAAALGADARTIRPAMKKLISDGKVRTQGQRRGMTYSAV